MKYRMKGPMPITDAELTTRYADMLAALGLKHDCASSAFCSRLIRKVSSLARSAPNWAFHRQRSRITSIS